MSATGAAMRITSMVPVVSTRSHKLAGVTGAAAVLADEDAQEILQAHLLEPLHRLDDHMMALAAQNAAGDQDHLGVALDAPCGAHRLDALARDVVRIEALEIDAARHDRDFVPTACRSDH